MGGEHDSAAAEVSSCGVIGDSSGDTGFFPDVKIDPTTKNIAVSYHDFSSKALKFWYVTATSTGQVLLSSTANPTLTNAALVESSGVQTVRGRILAGPFPSN